MQVLCKMTENKRRKRKEIQLHYDDYYCLVVQLSICFCRSRLQNSWSVRTENNADKDHSRASAFVSIECSMIVSENQVIYSTSPILPSLRCTHVESLFLWNTVSAICSSRKAYNGGFSPLPPEPIIYFAAPR